MTVNKTKMCLAACLLFALQSSPVAAQFEDFTSDGGSDLQFFAPVDFDFDNMPVQRDSGLFFRYDKLSWAITGERATIGDPNEVVQSEIFLPQTAQSLGTSPATYQVVNSIQDAPPESEFAWGERYEFGWQSDGHAWEIGILDGPTVNTSDVYGFDEITIPGTLPYITRTSVPVNNLTNFDFDNIDPLLAVLLAPTGPNDFSTSINGFGSVAVNWRDNGGFLTGLRDYWIGTTSGPVVAGPGRQLIVAEVEGVFVNGILTSVQITEAGVFSGAGGDVDDLNGNGLTFFFIDLDGDDTHDTGEPFGFDFGDLHGFNVFYDTVLVRSTAQTDGVEVMKTIDLPNRHKLKKHQNGHVKLGAGVRYFQLDDQFYFEGRGSVLGLTTITTDTQNSIFGPQVRGQYSKRWGRVGLDIDGRFMWGFNVQDLDLDANIGQDLLPGGLNSSASGRPTATRTGRHDETFSPMVEFRADASYNITSAISARVGYTAMFIDNITRGSQVVDYVLPNPGLLKGGQQDVFINGANIGFDVVY